MEHIVLFSKAPRLNEVKTRLAPRLTAEQALALHEAMLLDQAGFVRGLEEAGRTSALSFDLPFTPPPALASAMAGMTVTLQGDGDLGARMARAIADALARGAQRAAILGADAPTVPRRLVEDAFSRLRSGADAAVIPAPDGGYVFVGASRPPAPLFAGIPWGSSSVLAATRKNAESLGWLLAETAPWPDVDLASDLPRLAREVATDPSRAPATAAALARFGLYASEDRVL